LEIIFLGTGTSQGIPVIGSNDPVCFSTDIRDKRLRSSLFIKCKDTQFVIDCGPDFREQMLKNKIVDISAILFTHEHSDHTAGLDDIRPFCRKKGPMPIYAHKRVIKNLAHRFAYIFATEERYYGAPSVKPYAINNEIFKLGHVEVTPVNCRHGDLQVYGFRIENFAYLTDVKSVDNKELDKLKNLDILVINALRIDKHPTHFNLEEALDFIKKVNPKKAYITHISHKLGFHKEVEKRLPKNVFLAYDNLKLQL
jgi:phosphoribosyl 1,2-cyclic phosphate phosphodiesterase